MAKFRWLTPDLNIRTKLLPGDIGAIVSMHGNIYAREHGFDHTFESAVAHELGELALSASARERIFMAERDGAVVGCVAIVAHSPEVARLRWFLVDPSARGAGLGTRLLYDAVRFARDCGYKRITLRTISVLNAAAHLYRSAGFHKVEEKPGRMGGVDVVEERYEMELTRTTRVDVA